MAFDPSSIKLDGFDPDNVIDGAAPAKAEQGDYLRGLKKYVPQMQEMYGAGKALVGKAIDSEGMVQSGIETMQDANRKVEEIGSKPTDEFTNVKDVGGAIDWAQHGLGQVTGNLAESLVAAGAGTLLGGVFGNPITAGVGGVGGLVGKQIIKKALKEQGEAIAENQAKKIIGKEVGQNTAIAGMAGFHGAGETGSRAFQEANYDPNQVELGQVLPRAAGHAAAEFLGDKILLGGMLGKGAYRAAGEGAYPLVKTVAGNMAIVAGKEIPVELVQTVLERDAAKLELMSPEARDEYINTAAQTMLFGIAGAPAGVRSYMAKPPQQTKPMTQEEAAADLTASNTELAGAMAAHDALPSDVPQIGYNGKPDAIIVPNQSGGTTEINRNDGALSAAVVDTGITGQMLDNGTTLVPFASRDAAQAAIDQREDADRLTVVPHPRVSGRFAMVPKDRLTLEAQDQAAMRRQQLEQEDGNAPQLDEAGNQGRGSVAGGGGGNASAISGIGGGSSNTSASSIPGRGTSMAMGTADATEYALALESAQSELAPQSAQPVSSMPGVQARNAERIAAARIAAEARGTALVDEEAAAANTSPSEAQIAAGNYKKGHIKVGPLDISVENPIGSTRSGKEGKKSWTTTMRAHYGYIKRTVGADGDQVDVFVKEGTPADHSGTVYVIDQFNPKTGRFDEHKGMVGYSSQADAARAYDDHFGDKSGPKRRKAVIGMPAATFARWAKEGDTTSPISQSGRTADEAQAEIAQSTGKLSPSRQKAAGRDPYAVAQEANDRRSGRTTGMPEQAPDNAAVERTIGATDFEEVKDEALPDAKDTDAPGTLTKQGANSLRMLAKLFGKKIVIFKSDADADGFYINGNTIYIKSDSSVSQLRVLGHEMMHALRRQAPKVYQQMLDAVSELLTDAELKAFYADYNKGETMPAEMSAEQRDALVEEWMADLGGNRWGEAEFWSSMFAKLEEQHGTTLAKKIINQLRMAVVKVINSLLRTIRGGTMFSVDRRMADNLENIREAMAQGFADYAKAVKDNQVSEDGVGEVKFSGKQTNIDKLKKLMTDREKSKVGKRNADRIVELFNVMPSEKEMAAVAYAGKAKRGWYKNSANALTHLFGSEARRFAGLLAALSPQVSVEVNTRNSLRMWANWDSSGRPTDKPSIMRLLGQSVEGSGTEASVMGAWVNNSMEALTTNNLDNLTLSGPKVNSFMLNLVGNWDEVTNDAWVANYALVDQNLFSGTGKSKDGSDPGKGAGYLAMNVKTRMAAKILSKETGVTWTPAEVQETIWSWAKTMLETLDAYGETRTAKQLMNDGVITDDLIAATPDFELLFRQEPYAGILRNAGMGSKLNSMPMPKHEDPGRAPFADEKRQSLLDEAARRIEFLQRQRRTNMQISWEAKPGGTTGILPGIFGAPLHVQQQYLADIFAEFDMLQVGKKLGIDMRRTLFGPSAWKGDVAAGAQTILQKIGIVADNMGSVKVDADSRKNLEVAASVLGYVLNQEGVYWHYPIYSTPDNHAMYPTGVEVNFGRSLTTAEVAEFYGIVSRLAGHQDWAPANTPMGVRFLNFTSFNDNPEQQFDHKKFEKIIERAAGRLKPWANGATMRAFTFDGDAIENNWKESPNGEDYKSRVGKAGRSDLLEWADDQLSPAIDRVNKRYADQYGWGPASRLERDAAATGATPDNFSARFSPARSDAAGDERAGGSTAGQPSQALPEYGTETPGSVSAQGFHYSGSERKQLDGRYYGTGAKGREADRVRAASDPRIKERIYFYVDAGNGVTPEQGVGANGHTVNLNNLYDIDKDSWLQKQLPRGLVGGDLENAFESAVIDNGFDGYVSDFGTQRAAVLIGRHSVPVASTGMGKQTGAVNVETAPKTERRTDLPMGKMTGAEWKKLEPRATNLEDGKMYYRDDIKFSTARKLDKESTDESLPQVWYRGQIGASAEKGPFDATALGAPSFADSAEIASEYAMNPEAAGLYGFGSRPSGYSDNGNVAPYRITGKIFDARSLQGGQGTQTGLVPSAVNKILKELGLNDEDVMLDYAGKYGRGSDAFWDSAEYDLPDSRKILAAYTLFDQPEVQEALRNKGYAGAVFNGAMSTTTPSDSSVPWPESKVHGELRAVMPGSLSSSISPDIRYSPPRWYFSPLEKAFESAPDKVFGQAAQVKLWLAGNKSKLGLKDDEIFWTGINDWLDMQGKKKVSKADVLGYLAGNGVQVEEVMKGGETGLTSSQKERLDELESNRDRTDEEDDEFQHLIRIENDADGEVDSTKYGKYQLPGGTNYRELLLTFPSKTTKKVPVKLTWEEQTESLIASELPNGNLITIFSDEDGGNAELQVMTTDAVDVGVPQQFNSVDDAKAAAEQMAVEKKQDTVGAYRSSHWDEPNILAHIRMNDRTDADGNKVLFIEEAQSDWGQEGKKKGFAPEKLGKPISDDEYARAGVLQRRQRDYGDLTPEETADLNELMRRNAIAYRGTAGPPTAPFVTDTKAWLGLSIKRIMAYAAANGYDKVAFVNGEQSADRYDLSKQISYISYAHDNGMVRVQAVGKNGQVIFNDKKKPDELEDVVGKEVAQKIIDRNGDRSLAALWPDWSGPHYRLSGLDLKVGGEGMKAFYDRIVPQVVSDQLKKVGGKMEVVRINTKGQDSDFQDFVKAGVMNAVRTEQPGFTVTPKMSEPLPLFSPRRQTETPEFKKWFGDSKVVDADGKPLVVYHGTPKDFSVFKGKRIWVTSDTELASVYTKEGITEQGSGGNIMPLYVSIKNPKVFSLPDDGLREWSRSKTDEALARDGHDGVMFVDNDGNIKTAYAFEPTQIKSAIGNNGQFDPANPDIRKSTSRIIGASTRPYSQDHTDFFKRVGRTIDEPSFLEKLGAMRSDFGKKMATGIVDQFRGLKDLGPGGMQAYMLSRLSKGASGAFDALLHHGKLRLRDNVYDADTSGGFVDRLGIPLNGELEDFMWWVAANRADTLAAQGKENLFSPQDIASGKSLASGQTTFDYQLPGGATTRNRALIYKDALRIFNEFNKNTLDMAEQSGLIDGASRPYWENQFYVPFYRVSEEDNEFIGSNIKSGLVRQRAFQKLKGGTDKLNSDLLSNTLLNWSHLIDASAKNRAAKASLQAAEQAGVAQKVAPDMASYAQSNGALLPPGTKKTVWYMDNGQKQEYKVTDPFVMTAITGLEYAGMRNPIMDTLSKFKHWLTVGVTASPAFKVRNLIRDSLQAIGASELGYNPVTNVVKGFKASNRASQDYVSALAGGGLIRFGTMLEGSESARVRQLIKSGVKDSTILNSEGKLQQFYDRTLEPLVSAYNEIGNRGEEINRMALYKQLVAQGRSHAEASLLARDLMDFSMQGSFNTIRFLTQIVPFMNARLQGMYKLGRAAKDDPRKLAIVTGATALFSIALMMASEDDDDWKKREDWDRDNFWWFKIGDTAWRIPKPFEVGAVATLAERSVELMLNDEMNGERYRKILKSLLLNNLSMNPVPQAIKPIVDLYANKDSFTGRPIENMSMQRLDPTERYTANTSLPARAVSASIGGAMSPVQVDHVVRGYFSWLGTFVVGGADMLSRAASNEPTRPTMDYLKFATQGIGQEVGSGGSRYITQMYDQANELEQAHATWNHLKREGRIEEAREYMAEHADELKRYKPLAKVKEMESKLNERIRAIERSNIDPDQKKTQIDNVKKMKDQVARRVAPGVD